LAFVSPREASTRQVDPELLSGDEEQEQLIMLLSFFLFLLWPEESERYSSAEECVCFPNA